MRCKTGRHTWTKEEDAQRCCNGYRGELLPAAAKQQRLLAIGASAVLFGLAHWAGGWSYVLLAALAGLGYALAFRASGRLEMAILAHCGLNSMHFLLLTYPSLAA